MSCLSSKDICLVRGATLDETIILESPIDCDDFPCESKLVLRISRGGKAFKTFQSSLGEIEIQTDSEGQSVRLWAASSVFGDVPPLKYVFDLYSSCADRKYVVCSGFFDLQGTTVFCDDEPRVGKLEPTTTCLTGSAPVILDANTALSICCDTQQPLYFEFFSPNGISEAYIDTDFGAWDFYARYNGRWVKDNAFSICATRYRAEYTRFLPYADKWTSDWDRGSFKGGVQDCGTCSGGVDCSDFCLTLVVKDLCDQTTQESFCATVFNKKGTDTSGSQTIDVDFIGVTQSCGGISFLDPANPSQLISSGCFGNPAILLNP